MKAQRTQEKVKLCPRCGNDKIIYRPGIDIGMMYGICMNCGFKANEPLFPELSRKDARKIKVKKGKELDDMHRENIKKHSRKKLWMLAAIVIFFIIAFFMVF